MERKNEKKLLIDKLGMQRKKCFQQEEIIKEILVEKVKRYFPLIIGGIVAIAVFIVSRSKKNETGTDRNAILEKAREAKLAKSILKKSENDEESTSDSGE